jgi:glycosyltransferase involved in cell wall biosynthesis
MKIEIILRTHDKSNVHKTSRTDIEIEERYCKKNKKTLALGCITSLIKSANQIKEHQINFKIFDDHSTDDFLVEMEELFDKSKCPHELIHLKESGFNNSALKGFEACKNSDADLVYLVEDDFLHIPSALEEMINSWFMFTQLSGREIILYPYDFTDDYNPPQNHMVVYGSNRHWRTGLWTTYTLFLRPQVVLANWELFETLALKYDPTYSIPAEENVSELSTIGKIWTEGSAMRFSPIPSIALHMQFERQKDPYINWEQWWNDYTVI